MSPLQEHTRTAPDASPSAPGAPVAALDLTLNRRRIMVFTMLTFLVLL